MNGLTQKKQILIDKIADEIIEYKTTHCNRKPIRIYISTALYSLIAEEKWKLYSKCRMFGVEIKCFDSKEFEYSICEVVKQEEIF